KGYIQVPETPNFTKIFVPKSDGWTHLSLNITVQDKQIGANIQPRIDVDPAGTAWALGHPEPQVGLSDMYNMRETDLRDTVKRASDTEVSFVQNGNVFMLAVVGKGTKIEASPSLGPSPSLNFSVVPSGNDRVDLSYYQVIQLEAPQYQLMKQ